MNEQVALSKAHPLKARFFNYPHFTYPWHFHPEFEIIYIREGRGQRFIGNSTAAFQQGDVMLIGSNLPHYLKSDDIYLTGGNFRLEGTIIQFEKDFMQDAIGNYPHFAKVKHLLEESQKGIYFWADRSSRIVSLLEQIPLSNGVAQIILMLELLNEFAENKDYITLSVLDTNMEQMKYSSKIDKVLAYLNKRYVLNVSLPEIASYAAMNPAAFCRFFKAHTGKSFKTFLLDMRIEFACKLLIIDKSDIANISGLCGFETISHFNKSFKRKMGFCPSVYRKMFLSSSKT